MAESNRRGDETAPEHVEDVFDDAVDDDAPLGGTGKGGTATKARPSKPKTGGGAGLFARLGRFVREVVAELRKVIWPTRNELITYAAVVIVFVAVMMTIVAGLDFGFAKGVLLVFGG